MKIIFSVILLAVSAQTHAQDYPLMQDGINQPLMGIRCKELFAERSDKIKIQQKLSNLLKRNEGLVRKSPKSKKNLHARLESSKIKIKNELHLTNFQIETMEENIVRSGCPGLSL